MTAPVLERPDLATTVPRCAVEDHPGEPACGDRAVADLLMSCPSDHEEGVIVCGRHLAMARAGELFCNDCAPPTTAFVVLEVPL